MLITTGCGNSGSSKGSDALFVEAPYQAELNQALLRFNQNEEFLAWRNCPKGIGYANKFSNTNPSALAEFQGRFLVLLKPSVRYFKERSNDVDIIVSILLHEISHCFVGREHDQAFDDDYRYRISRMDIPYVNYLRL